MGLPGFFPATSMPDQDWWEALWPDPGAVLAALGIAPDTGIAIDLCCGDGLFTRPLAALAREVIGLDLDPAMLERTRRKLAGVGNAILIEGDAYDVARLAPRKAEAVFIANTFHGVPDQPRLARAVADALRPEGRFIVVNWHRRPREATPVLGQPRGPSTEMRMEPGDVAAVVEPAGFRLARTVELPPYHYGSIFTKPKG